MLWMNVALKDSSQHFAGSGPIGLSWELLLLPLGPTFANIFTCCKEKLWFGSCPELFKPILYKRYVEDTFLLFNDVSHAHLFLIYLNSQQTSIKFSMDCESDNRLNFLDYSVYKDCNKFHTSVSRKKNFTDLGTSVFSFCSFSFKVNFSKTLIFRGFKISSSYKAMHIEFEFFEGHFYIKWFPLGLINSVIKIFCLTSIILYQFHPLKFVKFIFQYHILGNNLKNWRPNSYFYFQNILRT